MNINRNMFGASDAARNLADMVAEADNPIYLRKVARFLNTNSAIIKTLNEIPNLQHRRALSKLVKRSIVESNMDVPEKLKTHAINVAVGQLRRAMESWEPPNLDKLPLYPNTPEFDFIRESVEETRRLDAEDVRSGRRSPDYFHFIPREMVRNATIHWPKRFKR